MKVNPPVGRKVKLQVILDGHRSICDVFVDKDWESFPDDFAHFSTLRLIDKIQFSCREVGVVYLRSKRF